MIFGGGERERGNQCRRSWCCAACPPSWQCSILLIAPSPSLRRHSVSGAVLFVSLERGHPVYGAASKLSRFGSSRRS
jgi:hypothetical protein